MGIHIECEHDPVHVYFAKFTKLDLSSSAFKICTPNPTDPLPTSDPTRPRRFLGRPRRQLFKLDWGGATALAAVGSFSDSVSPSDGIGHLWTMPVATRLPSSDGLQLTVRWPHRAIGTVGYRIRSFAWDAIRVGTLATWGTNLDLRSATSSFVGVTCNHFDGLH